MISEGSCDTEDE